MAPLSMSSVCAVNLPTGKVLEKQLGCYSDEHFCGFQEPENCEASLY